MAHHGGLPTYLKPCLGWQTLGVGQKVVVVVAGEHPKFRIGKDGMTIPKKMKQS